ncbi:MAG: polysaccharide deacetylase family protein [Gammaproteobacteria bacterium]
MNVALKVDVDTLRGTRLGVPALRQLFHDAGAGATFLFSVGPDHTGRALRRVFRRGFLGKVRRTSIVQNYGLGTLLYGTLLPGPPIGRRAGEILRETRAQGFEVGLHAYDHVRWQDFVGQRGERWTRHEFEQGADAFQSVFGMRPETAGAAGWQMNAHAFLAEEEAGLRYASDCRGSGPFYPMIGGRVFRCLQLPSTLPTLDELIGRHGIHDENLADVLFEASRRRAGDQVFTLHAELEGIRHRAVLKRLLTLWREAGVPCVSLGAMYQGLDLARVPVCEVRMGTVPGRTGRLARQGRARDGTETQSADARSLPISAFSLVESNR